jgi:ribose transport system ATP-binding protein
VDQPFISIRGLGKRFPGVVALDDVGFDIGRGEIHALLGENGAGKSTLIKILAGVYSQDEGEILVDGRLLVVENPRQAQERGITTIHQELALAPDLTVVQNVFLGRELHRHLFGRRTSMLDDRAMERRVADLAEEFELDRADFHIPAGELGALKQHVTEILKALAFHANLVIMDEPTAGLTDHEREALFRHMRSMRDRGVSILWVTHRIEELRGLADRASVLRDGRYVGTVDPEAAGVETLVRMMVGREIKTLAELTGEAVSARNGNGAGAEALRVEGLSRHPLLHDLSFDLHEGEIVGIAGLAGAGRTELARAILGADRIDAGDVFVGGKPVTIASPRDAYRNGIAFVPEERKVQGIFAEFSVAKNISAAALWRVLRARFAIDRRREDKAAEGYVRELAIRTPSVHQKIGFLSGGNQQKAVIARCLFARPKVVIFDEPTQGIDIGAKTEIYRLIDHFVHSGGAAVVISSELPELIGISDRILVMRAGRFAGEVAGERGSVVAEAERGHEERIMLLATGGD